MPRSSFLVAARVALASGLSLACGTAQFLERHPEPELHLIYSPAAQAHGPDRNPIIVIPGLLGTRLRDPASGRLVWGAFDAVGGGSDAEDLRLLGLPVGDDVAVDELSDGLIPDGVLDRIRIRLAGIPLEVEAYARILATLGVGGYRDEALGLAGEVDYGDDHFTCFQFDYDWRLDNVANAKRLDAFIREKRALVQREYRARYGIEDAAVRFDLAAHSMGGLLVRWFLRYGAQDLGPEGEAPPLDWAGARFVERAILIATPNAGSIEAFESLVDGEQLAPLLPVYPPALIGTFPSAYQLLPRTRHRAIVWEGDEAEAVSLMDPEVWAAKGWGLAAPDQDAVLEKLLPRSIDAATRRRLALRVQRRMLARAASFQAALDVPAAPPPGTELFLVAGDADGTPARLVVERTGARRVASRGPGDGTVLRGSALMDERMGERVFRPGLDSPIRWRSVLLLPENHLGLTKSATFRDNVLFWLLEGQRGAPRPRASSGS